MGVTCNATQPTRPLGCGIRVALGNVFHRNANIKPGCLVREWRSLRRDRLSGDFARDCAPHHGEGVSSIRDAFRRPSDRHSRSVRGRQHLTEDVV
jgi:hypothetical protein